MVTCPDCEVGTAFESLPLTVRDAVSIWAGRYQEARKRGAKTLRTPEDSLMWWAACSASLAMSSTVAFDIARYAGQAAAYADALVLLREQPRESQLAFDLEGA